MECILAALIAGRLGPGCPAILWNEVPDLGTMAKLSQRTNYFLNPTPN